MAIPLDLDQPCVFQQGQPRSVSQASAASAPPTFETSHMHRREGPLVLVHIPWSLVWNSAQNSD